MPLPGSGEIYRFGAFELAAGTGELGKNGLRLKLPDQAVRLSILLPENAGEVASREQIQERLWAGGVALTQSAHQRPIHTAKRYATRPESQLKMY